MKRIDEVMKAIRLCSSGEENCCEECPYVAAGESCECEMKADMVTLAEILPDSLEWAMNAISWLYKNDPLTLVTMCDAIGWYPSALIKADTGEENA